ncbi:hypothetical protein ACLI4Z_11585 [Natrialbaceae archaeon A-arb3/5]
MIRSVIDWIRTWINPGDLVAVLLVAGILSLFGFELSVRTVLGTAVAVLIVAPIFGFVLDRLDLHPGLLIVALGVLVGAGGALNVRDGNPWLGWPLVALAGWLCLEGIDQYRHGGPSTESTEPDDVSNSELLLQGEHNRWLIEALRDADRPLSAAEIQSRTGLTDEQFERLLEYHGENGPIDRVGTGYVLDERELGVTGMVRAFVRTVGGRLLRPFRLFRPSG